MLFFANGQPTFSRSCIFHEWKAVKTEEREYQIHDHLFCTNGVQNRFFTVSFSGKVSVGKSYALAHSQIST